MNKRIKRLWIRALRSGRYKQGDSALKSGGTYCCLGVLCSVMGVKWHKEAGESIPFLDGKPAGKADAPGGYLGSKILKMTGMKNSTQQNLAGMNDGGKTFEEIADYINKRL